MACSRLTAITILALALAAAQQTARSQNPAPAKDATCVVYPLAGIGHDPHLAQWLAEAIPSVVEPESWRADGVTITYHAPSKVLVVRQTPAVHAKVKAFLAEMKNATHEEKGAVHLRKAPVIQAEYTQAAPQKTPQTAGTGYPVPAPEKQPKHLFHLVLRYEGDGFSDDAVAGLVKQLSEGSVDKGEEKKTEPAKGPSLGQLLHFIVRYEGDGIIDANVVALMKELYGAKQDVGPRYTVPLSVEPPPPTFGTSPAQPGSLNGPPGISKPAWGASQPSSGSDPSPPRTPPTMPVTQPGSNPAQGGASLPASYPTWARPIVK